MPAKKHITKEMIFNASFELLEKEGSKAINARSIATYMNCSTQPIYLAYSGMDELKNDLIKKCKKEYEVYFNNEQADSVFMKSARSYIKFAFERPNLYKYVYIDNEYIEQEEDEFFDNNIINNIANVGNYPKDKAKDIYIQTWIFLYGLATQIVTKNIKWTWDSINEVLDKEFEMIKLFGKENK